MTEPTDKIDEQQLDEYLKGDSSVSRQYRQLPGAEVPPSLDRLVLRQAEEAVKRPSRPAWMRWTAPLAAAASAVLVVSIVLETGLRDETIVSAPVMQEKREVAAEAPIETKLIEESADAPPPPPKLEAPPPQAPAAAPVPRPAPPPVAAPAPAQSARAKPRVAHEAAEALLRAPAPTAQANSAAFVADAERQKQALEEAAQEQELSASQRAMRGEQDQVAGSRDTVEKAEPKAVLSYSRPISANADNMATLRKTYTDPEAWLKDIRQLRKDNKQDEADREWRRFRAAFPNYEVAETDSAREAKR